MFGCNFVVRTGSGMRWMKQSQVENHSMYSLFIYIYIYHKNQPNVSVSPLNQRYPQGMIGYCNLNYILMNHRIPGEPSSPSINRLIFGLLMLILGFVHQLMPHRGLSNPFQSRNIMLPSGISGKSYIIREIMRFNNVAHS